MKFKSQARQNQLIEKITAQHLVVGIDIAQQTHVARAVNFRGIIIGEPLSFSNDEDGFDRLLKWIQKLQSAHSLSETIIGMEPTGHYWLNVSRWLASRQFDVVAVRNTNCSDVRTRSRITPCRWPVTIHCLDKYTDRS
jgi:transposase